MQQINLATGDLRSFGHDAAGNVTQNNRNSVAYTYTYDAAGRMSELRVGSVLQASYTYDPMGRQVVRSQSSGQVIHSVFDSEGRRIAEYRQTPDVLLREYVWNGWEPVAVIEGGLVHFIRTDHIGRPVFATNTAGDVVWRASYDPFGNVLATTGTPTTIRVPGQWFQSESGLHQSWMRDYDPTTGSYMQADPHGLVDGASVYGYAGQSPMMNIDLTGECFGPLIALALACAGAAASVAIGWLLDPDCYTWEEASADAILGAAGGAAVKGAFTAWRGWRVRGSAATGDWTVYTGVGTDGVVRYVGRTSIGVGRRASQHAASSAAKAALRYAPVRGGTGLTKQAARGLEQRLINKYGGSKGGQLYNKINPIAPKYWPQFGL